MKKIYPNWLYRPGQMFNLLEKGPLQELYNIVFYTVKGIFKLNQVGYAETKSKHLATKISSMANGWKALLIRQRIPNNKLLAMAYTV